MSVGVIAIADVIPGMGAMSSFTFGDRQAVTMTTTMTEMDFSGQHLGAGDAVLIANDISDMEAISTVIVHKFPLPIQDIKTKAELDLSRKELNYLDDIVIAALLPLNVSRAIWISLLSLISLVDKGTLSLLNLASNELRAEGTKLLAAALKGNQIMTELNISSNAMTLGSGRGDISGVIALADVISDMRAMTSLNLASNKLGAEGTKIVADAIKVTKCTPAIVLAPFSCPSDFSINCCCLLLSAGYEGYDTFGYVKQQFLSR
jgi:hypothetical protein